MLEQVPSLEFTGDREMVAATAADGRPRHRVYRVERPMLVLGSGSRAEVELDLDACQRDGVPIYRRQGGGCAVVLDPGNLLLAVSLQVPGLLRSLEYFRRISSWIIIGLAQLGFPGLERAGSSDLVLGDRKIGGACIHRTRGLLHYSASLLVSPRVELMERYLRHPPREPDYRRGRSHRDFVGALQSRAGSGEIATLEHALQHLLQVEELAVPAPIAVVA